MRVLSTSLLNILVAALAVFSAAAYEIKAQKVIYVMPGVQQPSDVKLGDVLEVGKTIRTGKRGKVVLEYSWTDGDKTGYGLWLVGPKQSAARVPDLAKIRANVSSKKVDVEGFISRGSGINTIAFWDNYKADIPGAVSESVDVRSALAKAPHYLTGKVISVKDNDVIVQRSGAARETMKVRVERTTDLSSEKTLEELMNVNVYLEYVSRESESGPGEPTKKALALYPIHSCEFYARLDFVSQLSTGDCGTPPPGRSCLTFRDSFTWVVQDKPQERRTSDSPYGIQIQVVVGENAEYHHILYTDRVLVVPKESN